MLRLLACLCMVTSPWLVAGQIDSRTIMQFVVDQGLTTLQGFLVGTGLDKQLGDPTASAVTLFIPTEQAWSKLPSDVLIKLATNSTLLKEALQGHMVDQIVISQYLRDKEIKTNVNGDPLEIRIYPNGASTINGALLTGSDVSLANGVVHMIESVILPTDTNIAEYIAQHGTDFKDLFGLLVVGRLFAPLETGGPFTLFAPVDLAFDAIRDNVTALIQDRDALADILKYHVTNERYWSAGLSDGMKLPTLQGGQLTVRSDANGVLIDNARVIQADIPTSNGVIHVIDTVLTP